LQVDEAHGISFSLYICLILNRLDEAATAIDRIGRLQPRHKRQDKRKRQRKLFGERGLHLYAACQPCIHGPTAANYEMGNLAEENLGKLHGGGIDQIG
jgi:hypothetical protein